MFNIAIRVITWVPGRRYFAQSQHVCTRTVPKVTCANSSSLGTTLFVGLVHKHKTSGTIRGARAPKLQEQKPQAVLSRHRRMNWVKLRLAVAFLRLRRWRTVLGSAAGDQRACQSAAVKQNQGHGSLDTLGDDTRPSGERGRGRFGSRGKRGHSPQPATWAERQCMGAGQGGGPPTHGKANSSNVVNTQQACSVAVSRRESRLVP